MKQFAAPFSLGIRSSETIIPMPGPISALAHPCGTGV